MKKVFLPVLVLLSLFSTSGHSVSPPPGWVHVACTVWPGAHQIIVATGYNQTGTCYIMSVAYGGYSIPNLGEFGLDDQIHSARTGYQSQLGVWADKSYTGPYDIVHMSTGRNLTIPGPTSLVASEEF